MGAPFATRSAAPERLLEVTPKQFAALRSWIDACEGDANAEDSAKRAWLRDLRKDPRDFEHCRTAIVVAWIRL